MIKNIGIIVLNNMTKNDHSKIFSGYIDGQSIANNTALLNSLELHVQNPRDWKISINPVKEIPAKNDTKISLARNSIVTHFTKNKAITANNKSPYAETLIPFIIILKSKSFGNNKSESNCPSAILSAILLTP